MKQVTVHMISGTSIVLHLNEPAYATFKAWLDLSSDERGWGRFEDDEKSLRYLNPDAVEFIEIEKEKP